MADSVEAKFNSVVEEIRTGPAVDSSQDDKLFLYGLYKQATVGTSHPIPTPHP